MRWDSYIDNIINKGASRLNGIRRLRDLLSRKAKISLYKALVLPLIEYGSIIYDNCTFILKQRLECLQRRAAIICTRAFQNTSYAKLLEELGWDSLEDRRTLARRSLFYKMTHKLAPDYLCDMVPLSVGARVGCYVLRNSGDLTTVRTKKNQLYTSFLPKTVRDWNEDIGGWRGLDFATSIDSFKSQYRKKFLRRPNPFYNIELDNMNVYHARLRMGLSHLRYHLFIHSLIASPICQFCNIEPETVGHYILRCPTFHNARTNYLLGLIANCDTAYVNDLNDEKICDIFLHGDLNLDDHTNNVLFEMALTFISSTRRFDQRIVR